ncbi:MAG: dihydroneopterin aldolase [Bdellovibrionales bacterium]|nr:dihydroneopterin aldolase [Bdellovibrionales bacterium]
MPTRHAVVRIEELMTYVRIGVTDAERAYPQRLLISLGIETDISEAAQQRDLTRGICYAALTQSILSFVGEREWVLVEELTEAVSGHIFDAFPAARAVQVMIKKFAVPGTAWVGIESTRTREQF